MIVRRRLAALCRSMLPRSRAADRPAGIDRERFDDGAAVLEFAICAPLFIFLLIMTFDIGQMAFANAMLSGAVQDAARSSSLETRDTTAADNKVKAAMGRVLPGVTVITSRLSYFDFTDIGRKEKWNDRNSNGTCDNGEAFTDENGSGKWEADVGEAGNGGAGDVIVYEVSATYQPIFTIPNFWNTNAIRDAGKPRTLTARAVRKNQPFAKQEKYGSASGTCP